jgi:hypothetical protein
MVKRETQGVKKIYGSGDRNLRFKDWIRFKSTTLKQCNAETQIHAPSSSPPSAAQPHFHVFPSVSSTPRTTIPPTQVNFSLFLFTGEFFVSICLSFCIFIFCFFFFWGVDLVGMGSIGLCFDYLVF